MKDQYLIGLPQDDFIRVSDGTYMALCTKDISQIKDLKKRRDTKKDKFTIYQLVKVNL